jgi:hypothetical protein
MQRLLDTTADEPTTTARQRVAIVGVALVVTSLLCLAALLLGHWAYRVRLLASHEGRLAHLVAQKPSVDQVTQALENEKSPLVATPQSTAELESAIAIWGAERGGEIRAKGSHSAQTRVFRSTGVVYFLFFDQGRTLIEFTCVLR